MSSGSWFALAEKGGVWGIRILAAVAARVGRGPARLMLRFIALWYVALHGSVRRFSRAYLERVHGRPASFGSVYAHVLCFARVTLDRLFFVAGRIGQFAITFEGEEHLRQLCESRRGAILIGAHLGSFEAMRALAQRRDLKINVVGYFRNARGINEALVRLDPEVNTRVIHLEPDSVDCVLEIQERVEAGELVAILADRVPPSGRAVEVEFLGAPARFPSGPFLLAAALGCSVYLTVGLYREPNRYELSCELFAERVELPRGRREQALASVVGLYAQRLESYCRRAPDNWFNFYDFWSRQ